jgi:hypothetical protein
MKAAAASRAPGCNSAKTSMTTFENSPGRDAHDAPHAASSRRKGSAVANTTRSGSRGSSVAIFNASRWAVFNFVTGTSRPSACRGMDDASARNVASDWVPALARGRETACTARMLRRK